MFERWCVEHESPLIEERCAYKHGGGYECSHWYLVRAGIVVAECWPDRETRWLRGKYDGEERQIAGRKPDGTGGKTYTHSVDGEKGSSYLREVRRRWKERERAKREGREPAEWARKQEPWRRSA